MRPCGPWLGILRLPFSNHIQQPSICQPVKSGWNSEAGQWLVRVTTCLCALFKSHRMFQILRLDHYVWTGNLGILLLGGLRPQQAGVDHDILFGQI